jgi:hypothetical protein
MIDALRAGLANVVLARHGDQGLRISFHRVQEPPVELRVDEPGPGARQLMRHAPGTEHGDLQAGRERPDGPAHRLPQRVAPGRRGLRVLDDVDQQSHDRARPGVTGLRAEHRQRHGQPEIHVEGLADGEVEAVVDQLTYVMSSGGDVHLNADITVDNPEGAV